eukprot:12898773-Alexandrium_andersonii.AAC.1
MAGAGALRSARAEVATRAASARSASRRPAPSQQLPQRSAACRPWTRSGPCGPSPAGRPSRARHPRKRDGREAPADPRAS